MSADSPFHNAGLWPLLDFLSAWPGRHQADIDAPWRVPAPIATALAKLRESSRAPPLPSSAAQGSSPRRAWPVPPGPLPASMSNKFPRLRGTGTGPIFIDLDDDAGSAAQSAPASSPLLQFPRWGSPVRNIAPAPTISPRSPDAISAGSPEAASPDAISAVTPVASPAITPVPSPAGEELEAPTTWCPQGHSLAEQEAAAMVDGWSYTCDMCGSAITALPFFGCAACHWHCCHVCDTKRKEYVLRCARRLGLP